MSGLSRACRVLAEAVAVSVVAVATAVVTPASAATIPVTCPGPPTLQAAIDGATSGDTIEIAPAICAENIVIGKDLTITGGGAGSTILDGGFVGPVVTIDPGATVTIVGVTIRSGSSTNGGGVVNHGTLTIASSTVSQNAASEDGAAIYNNGGSLTLTRTLVADNVAQRSGGGIHSIGATGNVTLTDSEVAGNVAVQEHGGGLYVSDGTAILSNSTVNANTAGNDGGGVYAVGTGSLSLTNVTISGNDGGPDGLGQGGGIFVRNPTLALTNATIFDNDAFRGGGLWSQGGITSLFATILTGNRATSEIAPNPDCGQFGAVTITSSGFNLVGETAPSDCAYTSEASDLVGVDPRLGPLLDAGGPLTHALLIGSPARDAVTAGCPPPATDARGVSRPQGAACDIGAFEAGSSEPNSVGLVDPVNMEWHLLDPLGNETSFFYGAPGDVPIVGDWDCDGTDTPGAYRQADGFVYLRNSNSTGVGEIRFFLGIAGDVPLAGDFDGDGCDTVSVYRPSQGRVFIADTLGENDGFFVADFDYYFGIPGDKPYVGDYDGDDVDTIGLHREATGLVYFLNRHETAFADSEFFYGIPADRLVAADWTVDGNDSVAVFRPADQTFYFRFANSLGFADDTLIFGESDWLPVAGAFGL